MKRKKRFKIIIVIVLIVVASLVYSTYFNSSEEVNSPSGPSVQSPPGRCSLVSKNDTYIKPDFERLENIMQEQQIVRDVPKKGKISLRFYHFTEGCRIYDKNYILSNGKIQQGGGEADIYVIIASEYADKITADNFCDIIKQARANGDLSQWSDAGKTTLLWRYKSMLKYKGCLGFTID